MTLQHMKTIQHNGKPIKHLERRLFLRWWLTPHGQTKEPGAPRLETPLVSQPHVHTQRRLICNEFFFSLTQPRLCSRTSLFQLERGRELFSVSP